MAQEESPRQRLCIVRFEALPPPGGWAEDPDVAGAFVVCYVNNDSFFDAIACAAEAIQGEGWRIADPEYAEVEDVDALLEDEESSPYVREALEHGISCVYHCFPAEDE
jgi:hypothetical protein